MLRNHRLFFWLNLACALVTLVELVVLNALGGRSWSGVFVVSFFLLMAFLNGRKVSPKAQ